MLDWSTMMYVQVKYSLVLATFSYLLGSSASLKNVRVSVPHAIRRGETAVFMCDFDLEGDPLYTVKWYKGRSEFFRYTPKDEYPIKVFQIDGLNIDLAKSNMTRITILSVEPSLSDKYNCEVSVDQSFHTEIVSGEMDVIEIPYQAPVLSEARTKYKVGENLELNCTSGRSKPPANLTWYINGDPANPAYILPLTERQPDHTLVSSKSQISFIIKTHFFKGGQLKIRCAASIHNLYHQSTEVIISEERTRYGPGENIVLPPNFLNEEDDEGHRKRSSGDGSSCNLVLGSDRKVTTFIFVIFYLFYQVVVR